MTSDYSPIDQPSVGETSGGSARLLPFGAPNGIGIRSKPELQPAPHAAFVLQQIGLSKVGPNSNEFRTQGTQAKLHVRVALIDGRADITHPFFEGCQLTSVGDANSPQAAHHATFCASILTASDAARKAGHALGLCSMGEVINFAVVTEEMLTTRVVSNVARVLARAIDAATDRGCSVVVFALEFRFSVSPDWKPLRDALKRAARLGCAAFAPVGNRRGHDYFAPTCAWDELLLVSSLDYRGQRSPFSAPGPGVIFAPGENIPGAERTGSFAVQSGTSFAAAVAAAACARAVCEWSAASAFDIARALWQPPSRVLDGAALLSKRGTSCL